MQVLCEICGQPAIFKSIGNNQQLTRCNEHREEGMICDSPPSRMPIRLNVVRPSSSGTTSPQALTLKVVKPEQGPIKFPRIRKWTLEIFLERARIVHGNKYDYSAITAEMIKGARCKVPLTCNACQYLWSPSIDDHIQGRGCPNCAGVIPWTLERFIQRAMLTHGNKYDYSAVTSEMIKGNNSKVPVTCNTCQYKWSPTISNHIHHQKGCPKCAGNIPWTYERFIERAHSVHGQKYNYDLITPDMIKGCNSKIPITCNTCQYLWSPSIVSHINNKTGCPNCAGNIPWTLERFLEKARMVHVNKFSYKLVAPDMIKNQNSKVPIICNACQYQWEPTIGKHIIGRGCPNCAGKIKLTLEIFLQKATMIHGDKYDYSAIISEMIENNQSKVPVTCNTCQYKWSPRISNHIYGTGCPSCAGKVHYTLKLFLERARIVHGNKYDYSAVTSDMIEGCNSKIPITCNTCQYLWSPSIDNHIRGSGCPDCSGQAPWTFERFIDRAITIHKDKHDYSAITPEMVKTRKSEVPVTCNTCGYKWSPKIGNHIQGNGCPNCGDRIPWSLERFLERARMIHGDKYNYRDATPEMIKNQKSKVPITCNTCGYQWLTAISNHINKGTGCPDCSGTIRYTLDLLHKRARSVHGDKYDYSAVTPEMVMGNKSKIPITCNTCQLTWYSAINNHIYGKGCPSCAGVLQYTLERFKDRGALIHGNKYDYSAITSEMIENQYSKVPITCNVCQYQWLQSIVSHMRGNGCPNCAGNAPITLERFKEQAVSMYGDKYNYGAITPEMINGQESKVPITCNVCTYQWLSIVNNHLRGKGCPKCAGNARLTLETFKDRAHSVHGQNYDYSAVTSEMIKNSYSKVPITCNTCKSEFHQAINGHIWGSGCPKCKRSRGELACAQYLDSVNIPYTAEHIIDQVPRKRFDFFFEFNNKRYLLEYDGSQHFAYKDFFYRTEEEFHSRQEIDILKTVVALQSGYNVIRIDYTQLDHVPHHIATALNSQETVYFSSPELYIFITSRLNDPHLEDLKDILLEEDLDSDDEYFSDEDDEDDITDLTNELNALTVAPEIVQPPPQLVIKVQPPRPQVRLVVATQ